MTYLPKDSSREEVLRTDAEDALAVMNDALRAHSPTCRCCWGSTPTESLAERQGKAAYGYTRDDGED